MYNYGIALLKILAALTVVWLHFGDHPNGAYVPAVPIFIAVSFFLMYEKLSHGTASELFIRAKRLFVPFWFWGGAYWVLYCCVNRNVSLRMLLCQLTFGDTVCRPLYFYPILIFLTGLFYYILRFRGICRWVLMIGMLLLAMVLQYSGLNSAYASMWPEHSYVLGRIFELIPYGVVGCTFAAALAREWHHNEVIVGSLSAAMFIVAVLASHFFEIPKGYGYQGGPMLFCTIGWVALAIYIGKLLNRFHVEWTIVRTISSYMMGVYCLHYAVGKALESVVSGGGGLVVCDFALSLCLSMALARIKFFRRIVM